MFELPANDSASGENSQVNSREKRYGMNSLRNNMINCPTIITGMSHEMRTHMNAIVAFSYLMKEECCNNPDREEFSSHIFNSCEQLIRLFENFLDSAIIDSGNSEAEAKNCRLDNILDDLITEFRETIRKEGQNKLELVTEFEFTDSTEVFIDKDKILRIVRSLFQNSLFNTKSGYIKIGFNIVDCQMTFYVLDSGQGYFKCKEFLHTEDLSESLELYNDTYTAINITLAKKIIQMLGGSIWINCNGLAGSGIYFSLPVRKAADSSIIINKYNNSMIAI
jgi:K+-sensing histidine kinase KdpD